MGWDPWLPPESQVSDPLFNCNGEISYNLWVGGWPQKIGGSPSPSSSGPQPFAVGGWIDDDLTTAGPSGYTFCAYESGSCGFTGTADVAYGANGSFSYKYNQTGNVSCNNATFGDPLPNTAKACFYKGLSLPSITGLNPATVLVGSAGFNLSIQGNNFASSSKVRWDGADLATTFVNSSNLTASIPASYLSTARVANITVNNPVSGVAFPMRSSSRLRKPPMAATMWMTSASTRVAPQTQRRSTSM
jgi:hypothetical protein